MKYKKPFYELISNPVRQYEVNYPYSEAMLRNFDVFSLYILDGGAFLFLQDYLGTATGKAVLQSFRSGELLRPWMVSNELNWDHAYDSTVNSQCTTAIEQHVWLNRLYFLLPIAHEYFAGGDEDFAKTWYQYFLSWNQCHPYNVDARSQDEMKQCWSDMQVTWRLLVLIHSVQMLAESRYLKKDEWACIYDNIKTHSIHVLGETSSSLQKGTGHGNHYLQKGVALLYCAVCFPDFPNADELMDIGRKVVQSQSIDEIYGDGGSVEASPSYSYFIARLYLDAYLLLDNNGYKNIPKLANSIQKQYRHLEQIASPEGRSLQISDSYAMDTKIEMRIVRQLISLPEQIIANSICFQDSKFAVLRGQKFCIYVDAMPRGLWHHHDGYPNILMFIDGQPFLIDSGACSYDKSARDLWFRKPQAHNVLVVKNPAETVQNPALSERCDISEFSRNKIAINFEKKCAGWGFKWNRTIIMQGEDTVLLHDEIESSTCLSVCQFFHFPDINLIQVGQSEVVFQTRDRDVLFKTSAPPLILNYRAAYSSSNCPAVSSELMTQHLAKTVNIETVITLQCKTR